MSTPEAVVRLLAMVRIAPPDRPAFDHWYQRLQARVATEGPGQVLSYERYGPPAASPGDYLFHEAYADEAALLAHQALVAPVAAACPVPMAVVRYELLGPVSAKTVAALAGAYGEKFTHYGGRR